MFLRLLISIFTKILLGGLDLPGAASSPALAGGERSAVFPVNAVLACSTVVVGDTATTVGPEGIEVTIVGSLFVRGDGPLLQLIRERKGSHSCTGSHEEA